MAGAAQDSFSGRFWRDSFIFDISCVSSIFFDISFFWRGILGIVDDVLVDIFWYIFGYLMICLRILWIYGILLDSSRFFFFCEVVDAIHSWTTTPWWVKNAIFWLAELQCIHRESDVSREMTSPVAPGRFWRTLEIPWWDFATVWGP